MKKIVILICSFFVAGINAQEATSTPVSPNKDAAYHNRIGALKLGIAAAQTGALANITYTMYQIKAQKAFFLGIMGALGHGTYETYRSGFNSLNKAKKADKKENQEPSDQTRSLSHRLQDGAIGLSMAACMVIEAGVCTLFCGDALSRIETLKKEKKINTEKISSHLAVITAIPTAAFGAYKSGLYAWQSFRKAFAKSPSK